MDFLNIQPLVTEVLDLVETPNAYRSILILALALIASYIASRFVTQWLVKLIQIVGIKSDSISNYEKRVRYRQLETYLSITIALIRAIIVAIAAYIVWRLLAPQTSSSGLAAIGAGTFFIVFAGQTLGPMLRDITAGAAMITEGWFHVGDFIKIEPFWDVSGVVERFTLRSTKIRSLSGDAIWIHNQQIQAVHVTKHGVRAYIVDIFTRDPKEATKVIQKIIDAIPSTSALVKDAFNIEAVKEWNNGLQHVTVYARVAPGREWLVETFFINALKDANEGRDEKLFVYEPTARFADAVAEREFKRAMKLAK